MHFRSAGKGSPLCSLKNEFPQEPANNMLVGNWGNSWSQ